MTAPKHPSAGRGDSRVLRLYLPYRLIRLRDQVLFGIWMGFSLGAILAINAVPIVALARAVADPAATRLRIIGIILLILGALWVSMWLMQQSLWVFLNWYSANAPETEKRRQARLGRIAADPVAAQRLPHRWLEHQLLTARDQRPIGPEAIRRLPPGWVVVVDQRRPLRLDLAPAQQFEPRELHRDFDAVAALVPAHIDSKQGKRELAGSRFGNSSVPLWIMLGLISALGLALSAIEMLKGRSDLRPLLPLAFPGVVIAFGIIATQRPFSHRYWLIPGGIVFVPRAIFSKKRAFGRASATDSPLILFFGRTRPGSAYFLHRGRHHQIRASRPELIGLAAGWLSTAAPPSDEQVRALVNPD